MNTRPEALRLADELERDKWHVPAVVMQAAADELRRLHAERAAADGVINDLVAKVRELQEANEAFGKRQEWWNEKMLTLEAQRGALLEALKLMIDLAEFWINHRQERHMSEQEYKVWIALGHKSNAMLKARAAIKAVEEQPDLRRALDELARIDGELGLFNAPPRCPNCASLEAQHAVLDDMLVAMEHAVAQAAAVERKACADICDAHASCEGIAQQCAAAIRARGQA